jgi:hypothetical protein
MQAGWALLARPDRRRDILVANGAVALAFLPKFLTRDTDLLATIGGLNPATPHRLLTVSGRVIFGHPYAGFDQVPGLASIAAVCLTGLLIAAVMLRSRRPGKAPARRSWLAGGALKVPRVGWLLVALTAGVIAVTFIYSVAFTSIFLPRTLITVVPYVCVLAGAAAAALQGRLAVVAASALVLAALFGSVRMLVDYPRPDLQAAADAIADEAPPGTPVVQPFRFGHGPFDAPGDPLQQDLAIYLDDRYPITPIDDARDWPRGPEVYAVGFEEYTKAIEYWARGAGAQLVNAQSFDGFRDVSVMRYRSAPTVDPGALRTYLQKHPKERRRFQQRLKGD